MAESGSFLKKRTEKLLRNLGAPIRTGRSHNDQKFFAAFFSKKQSFLCFLLLLASEAHAQTGVAGTWQGSYVCAQGETALTLTLRDTGAATVRGIFTFSATETNPLVPDGCFEMAGVYAAPRLKLFAGRWLLRPSGYVSVDLAGTMTPDGASLDGAIIGPLCTSFTLRRVDQAARRIPPACRSAGDIVATVGP